MHAEEAPIYYIRNNIMKKLSDTAMMQSALILKNTYFLELHQNKIEMN